LSEILLGSCAILGGNATLEITPHLYYQPGPMTKPDVEVAIHTLAHRESFPDIGRMARFNSSVCDNEQPLMRVRTINTTPATATSASEPGWFFCWRCHTCHTTPYLFHIHSPYKGIFISFFTVYSHIIIYTPTLLYI
jgi:hypothetical protein